jgi:hypothetical protein
MFTDTADPAMPKALIGSKSNPEALDKLLSYYAATGFDYFVSSEAPGY